MRGLCVIVAAVLGLGLFTGCDNRECLRGHYDTVITFIYINNQPYPQPTQVWVCDEYAPEAQ